MVTEGRSTVRCPSCAITSFFFLQEGHCIKLSDQAANIESGFLHSEGLAVRNISIKIVQTKMGSIPNNPVLKAIRITKLPLTRAVYSIINIHGGSYTTTNSRGSLTVFEEEIGVCRQPSVPIVVLSDPNQNHKTKLRVCVKRDCRTQFT